MLYKSDRKKTPVTRWLRAPGLAAVLGMAALAGTKPAAAQNVQVDSANRTLSVSANDEAKRRADTASLSIGFRVHGADSQGTYAEAAQLSQAIAVALKKADVPDDAIESTGQSVQPVQDFASANVPATERAARKFEAQQSWTVKIAASGAAKVLAAAVAAGANESSVADWNVADEDSLTAEAASKALLRAKSIAAQMAGGLNAKLGQLLYASNQAESRGPMLLTARAMTKNFTGDKAPPQLSLNPPMVSRSATVSAIFALE